MTHEENKQRIKAEALNKIRKLFHPKTKHHYTYYEGEGSKMEQMALEVENIIKEMEKQLSELKRVCK